MTPSEQAEARSGTRREKLPAPRPQLSLEILDEITGEPIFFNLGPHPPRLWPEDTELLHRLWLELADKGPGYKLHHRDVVRVALRRLEAELHSTHPADVLKQVWKEASEETRPAEPPAQAGGRLRHEALPRRTLSSVSLRGKALFWLLRFSLRRDRLHRPAHCVLVAKVVVLDRPQVGVELVHERDAGRDVQPHDLLVGDVVKVFDQGAQAVAVALR